MARLTLVVLSALVVLAAVLVDSTYATTGYDTSLYPRGVGEWGYYDVDPMEVPEEGTAHDPVWDPSTGLSPHEARVKAEGPLQTKKYGEYMLTYPNTQSYKDKLEPLYISTQSKLRGSSQYTPPTNFNHAYNVAHGFEEEDDFTGLATQYQFTFGMSLPIPFPPVASFLKIGFEVGLTARERPQTHHSGIYMKGHFDIGLEFDFKIAKFGIYLHVSGGLKASQARMPTPYLNTIQTAIRYLILQKLRTLQEMCREKLVAEKKYLSNQRERLSMEIIREKLNGGKPIRTNTIYKFDVMRNGVTPLYYRKHSSKGWQWSPPQTTNQHKCSGIWMTVDDHTVDASLSLYMWQKPVKENIEIIDSLASMRMPERTAPCYHILRKHFSYSAIRTQTFFKVGRINLRVNSKGIWRWRKVANWAWQDECKNYVNLGRSHFCNGNQAESSERQLIDEMNICSADQQGASYRPPATNYRMTRRERVLHCISSPFKCAFGKLVQFANWISGGKLEAKFRELRQDTVKWIQRHGVKKELIMQAQIGIALKASAGTTTKFGGKFIAAAGILSKVNTNDPERSRTYSFRAASLQIKAEDIPVVGDIVIEGQQRVYSQQYLKDNKLSLTTKHYIAYVDVLLKQDIGITKILRITPAGIHRTAILNTAFGNRFKEVVIEKMAQLWPGVMSRFVQTSCAGAAEKVGASESAGGSFWGRLTRDWKDVLVNSLTGYLRSLPAALYLASARPRLGFRIEPRWTTSREDGPKAGGLNMDKSNLLVYIAFKSPTSEFEKLIPKAGPVSGKFKFLFSMSAMLPFSTFFPQAKKCKGDEVKPAINSGSSTSSTSTTTSSTSTTTSTSSTGGGLVSGLTRGIGNVGSWVTNGLSNLAAKMPKGTNGAGDEKCASAAGVCVDRALFSCDLTTFTVLSGHCAGNAERKCCTAKTPPGDEKCAEARGICHENAAASCLGPVFRAEGGKCGGPSARQCCIRSSDNWKPSGGLAP